MRVTTVVLLSLILLLNIVLFVLSVVQANSPNVGEKFRSTEQEHWGFNKVRNMSCGSEVRHPIRYMFESDKDLSQRYEYCPWRSGVTWWRCISMIFLIIGAVVSMGILGKKSPANDSAAIWQDPKNVLRAMLIPLGVCGFNMFLLMCTDAGAVNLSQNWCNSFAESMRDLNPVTCDLTPFVLTVIFDFFAIFVLGIGCFDHFPSSIEEI